jgi:hypothetical protein
VRSGGIDSLHAAIRTARHEPVRDDIAVVELRHVPSTESSLGSGTDVPRDQRTD